MAGETRLDGLDLGLPAPIPPPPQSVIDRAAGNDKPVPPSSPGFAPVRPGFAPVRPQAEAPKPAPPQSTVTDRGIQRRLLAYFIWGGAGYLAANLDHHHPPTLWQWCLILIGLAGTLAAIYRAYVDQSMTENAVNKQVQQQTGDPNTTQEAAV